VKEMGESNRSNPGNYTRR